jgi:hypothetical protein
MRSSLTTRGTLASGSIAVLALGVAAACSSSSSSTTPPGTDASSSSDSGGLPMPSPDGATPPFVGPGMLCPTQSEATVATRLTLDVTWPGTTSTAAPKAGSNPQLFIWLLSNYTVNGTTITGNTFTCGNETPPFSLTAVGNQAQGEPGGMAALQITFLTPVWDAIMKKLSAGFAATGSIGGWNIGSSFQINPSTSVLGLLPSSTYAQPGTPWPGSETAIPASDYSDDDNDGHPGITATPLGSSATSTPYVLPVTGLASPPAPAAQSLFVVTRTEISLYGESTSCTEGQGTATVSLLNNHVIGCELLGYSGDGGDADTSELCDDGAASGSQTQFLDTNTTQYQVLSGTYTSMQITPDSGIPDTCESVRMLLPGPTTTM